MLMEDAKQGLELEVDLENQKVVRSNGDSIPFEVDQFRKKCLMEGLDDIGLTLQQVCFFLVQSACSFCPPSLHPSPQ